MSLVPEKPNGKCQDRTKILIVIHFCVLLILFTNMLSCVLLILITNSFASMCSYVHSFTLLEDEDSEKNVSIHHKRKNCFSFCTMELFVEWLCYVVEIILGSNNMSPSSSVSQEN